MRCSRESTGRQLLGRGLGLRSLREFAEELLQVVVDYLFGTESGGLKFATQALAGWEQLLASISEDERGRLPAPDHDDG